MMYIEEKAHYSLYYKLKNSFSELDVKDSFPKDVLAVPTLSVNLLSVDFTKLELGNYNNIRKLTWIIDVFCRNKAQRDRATFKLFSILENKIPIYNYDLGFPPVSVPEIGALEPEQLKIDFTELEVENVEELYYRASGLLIASIQTY